MDTATLTRRTDAITRQFAPNTLRVIAGLLWLSNVAWKVPTGFGRSADGCGALCGYVAAGSEHPVTPVTGWMFEHLIGPHLSVFGWVTVFVEVGLAVTLLAGRFVRVAAIVGLVQSVAIGLAVANAPNEWYLAYVLMVALHLAVLVDAPAMRPTRARIMAAVTMVYGLVVATSHVEAGLGGDANSTWTLFRGFNHIPDEFGRNIFPGSIALGALFVFVGAAAWLIARTEPRIRRLAGWALVGAAALLLLTYRESGLIFGLGSTSVTSGVLATLGLTLTVADSGRSGGGDDPDGATQLDA